MSLVNVIALIFTYLFWHILVPHVDVALTADDSCFTRELGASVDITKIRSYAQVYSLFMLNISHLFSRVFVCLV